MSVSNIKTPFNEAVARLEHATDLIQAEYGFLSRYLSEEDKSRYAKVFVELEDLAQILLCTQEEDS